MGSKEHTSLPMQSLNVPAQNEKGFHGHDPINGHPHGPSGISTPSVGTPGAGGLGAAPHTSVGLLPGGPAKQDKKKMHPAVIISLWISLSSAVIVYNK